MRIRQPRTATLLCHPSVEQRDIQVQRCQAVAMSACSASPIRMERIATGLQQHHSLRSSSEKPSPSPSEKQESHSIILPSSCRSDLQALRASSNSDSDVSSAHSESGLSSRRGHQSQMKSGNADEAPSAPLGAATEPRDPLCKHRPQVDVTVVASEETPGSAAVNNATETQTHINEANLADTDISQGNMTTTQKGTQSNLTTSPEKLMKSETAAPTEPSPIASCSSAPGSSSHTAANPYLKVIHHDEDSALIVNAGGCCNHLLPSSSSPISPTTTTIDYSGASDHTANDDDASSPATPSSPLSPSSSAACTKLKPDAPSFTPTSSPAAAATSTRMSAYGVRLRIIKPGGGRSRPTTPHHSPVAKEEAKHILHRPDCSPSDNKPRHDRPPPAEAMIDPSPPTPHPEAKQFTSVFPSSSFGHDEKTIDAQGDGTSVQLPVHPHVTSNKQHQQLLGMMDQDPPQEPPMLLTAPPLPEQSLSMPSATDKTSPFTQTKLLQQQQQQLNSPGDGHPRCWPHSSSAAAMTRPCGSGWCLGPAAATPSATASNPRPLRPAPPHQARLPDAAPAHHHRQFGQDHHDDDAQQQPQQPSMDVPGLHRHHGVPSSNNSSDSKAIGVSIPPMFQQKLNHLPEAHRGDVKYHKPASHSMQLPGSSSSNLEAACGFRPASAPPCSADAVDTDGNDDGPLFSSVRASEADDIIGASSGPTEACSAASTARARTSKVAAGHLGSVPRAGMEGEEQEQSETPTEAASVPLARPLLHLTEGTVEEALWILEQAQATSCTQAPSYNQQNQQQHQQHQQEAAPSSHGDRQLLLLEALSTATAAEEAKAAAVMPLPQSMPTAMVETAGQQHAYYSHEMQMRLCHEMQEPCYQMHQLPRDSSAASGGTVTSVLGQQQAAAPSASPVTPQQQPHLLQPPASADAPTRTATCPLRTHHLQQQEVQGQPAVEVEPIRQRTSAMMPHSSFSGAGNSHSASSPALLEGASPSIRSTTSPSDELPFYPDAFLGSEGNAVGGGGGGGGGMLTLDQQWQLAAGLGLGLATCLPHHIQQPQQQQRSPSPSQQQQGAMPSPLQQQQQQQQQSHQVLLGHQPLPVQQSPVSPAEALLMSSLPQLHQRQHSLPPGSSSPSSAAATAQQEQQQRHLQQLQQLQQETELIMSRLGLGMGPPLTQQQQQQLMLLQSGDQDAAGAGSAAPNSTKQHSLYKTELCRSWSESGSCRYGSKCQFAHGPEELRHIQRHPKYKTEICRTFATTGTCPYGARCRFIHCSASQGDKVVESQQQQLMLLLEQQQAEMGVHMMPSTTELQQQPPPQQQILSYYPSFAAASNLSPGMAVSSGGGGAVFLPQQLPQQPGTPSSATTSVAAMPLPGSLQALLDQTLAPRTPPQQTAIAGATSLGYSKTTAPMQQQQQQHQSDVVAPGPYVRLHQDYVPQPADGASAAASATASSNGRRDKQQRHHHHQQQLQNLGFKEISLSPDSASSEATAASPGSPQRRLPIFAGLLDSVPPFDLYKALP